MARDPLFAPPLKGATCEGEEKVPYSCTIYGLTFTFPFPCPFLPLMPDNFPPDVTVAYGTAPKDLPGGVSCKDMPGAQNWQASPGRYLFKGGMRAGRFLVEDGRRVTIDLSPYAEDDRVLHLFFRHVLAVVLKQRGSLVLHASAAAADTGGVVIAGKSGMGKSTALTALLARGYPMLADDVTVLANGHGGAVEVLPGPPHIQVCDGTAEILGLDVTGSARSPLKPSKLVLSLHRGLSESPAPLQSLYILEAGPPHGDVTLARLAGSDKFEALLECTYGPVITEDHPGLFGLFSAAARQADIFRIRRPEGRWTLDEVIRIVTGG